MIQRYTDKHFTLRFREIQLQHVIQETGERNVNSFVGEKVKK
jgi:hypothetical protein